mgnify:CR=1 FL=1|tara:strand:- start:522 stop:752 length:231 start_codon:yes stop_codon:yes gene_type:complete
MKTEKEKVYIVGTNEWHAQSRDDKIQSVRDGIWTMWTKVREHKGKTLQRFAVEQILFELGCYANCITKKEGNDEEK